MSARRQRAAVCAATCTAACLLFVLLGACSQDERFSTLYNVACDRYDDTLRVNRGWALDAGRWREFGDESNDRWMSGHMSSADATQVRWLMSAEALRVMETHALDAPVEAYSWPPFSSRFFWYPSEPDVTNYVVHLRHPRRRAFYFTSTQTHEDVVALLGTLDELIAAAP